MGRDASAHDDAQDVAPGLVGRLHGVRARIGGLLAGGVLLSLLALAALGGLMRGVATGRTAAWDARGIRWLDARATPWLDRAAVEVTALGDAVVVAAIALVAATLLWQVGRRAYAALVAAGAGGAWVLAAVLKELFGRPRPALIEWRVHDVTSWSFPSGHATLSMALAAVLAYVVHRLAGGWRAGAAALLAGSAVVLLVGLSRVYLGVHYPSDVAAGYAVGFAWATACALGAESIRPRRSPRARTRPVRPLQRSAARVP